MTTGRRSSSGITLVELIMAFGILFIGGGVLLVFLQKHMDFGETAIGQGDLATRAQLALDAIGKDLRPATRSAGGSPPAISIPASPGNTNMTFYLPTDLDGDGYIIDASGNLEWNTTTPVQYQYNASARQLLRVAGASTRVVVADVSNVRFSDQTINASLNANEVQVQLTLQRSTPQGRSLSTTATALVRLRN